MSDAQDAPAPTCLRQPSAPWQRRKPAARHAKGMHPCPRNWEDEMVLTLRAMAIGRKRASLSISKGRG